MFELPETKHDVEPEEQTADVVSDGEAVQAPEPERQVPVIK